MSTHTLSRSIFALATLGAAFSISADAATFTWNSSSNGGGNTYQWGTGSNWVGGVAPVSAGDTILEFGAAGNGGGYTMENNVSAPFLLNSLRFTGSTSSNQGSLSGGAISFVDNGGTGPSIQQNGSLQFNIGTAMQVNTLLTLGGTGSGQIALNGTMTGSGSLVINSTNNAGFILSNGGNTFSGGVTLNSGRLVVQANSALTSGTISRGSLGTGTLTLNGGSIRGAAADRILHNDVVIGGNVTFGDGTAFSRSITFAGPTLISGSNATRTLTLSGSNASAVAVVFGGALGDGGANNGITINGSGVAVFGSGASDAVANTYKGATLVNSANATLRLDKASGTNAIGGDLTLTSGSVAFKRGNQIADTATVTVNGSTFNFADNVTALDAGVDETIAALIVKGGIVNIDPSGNSGNRVTVTGDASFSGGVTRVNASSTLSAGSVHLSGTTASALRIGGTLAVGSGGITLTQADTGGSGGYLDILRLSAESGDGSSLTAGVLQLNGSFTVVASNINSNGLRIITSGLSAAAIDVHGGNRIFDIGRGIGDADLTVNARFIDSIGGGGFTKTGAGIMVLNYNNAKFQGDVTVNQGVLRYGAGGSLAGDITVTGSTAVLDLANNFDTVRTVTLDNGGTITSGTGALTSVTSYEMKSGIVDTNLNGANATLNKTGEGTLVLKRMNGYGGGTTLAAGITSIVTQTAFGSGAIQFNGGTLRIDSSATSDKVISNALNIGGDITLGAAGSAWKMTFSGATKLDGGTRAITTLGPGVTLSGAVSDGGEGYGIIKKGSGTLTLDGENSYTGLTRVDEGTLVVGSAENTGSLQGAVLVSQGALAGHGRIAGDVTVAQGAILTPGTDGIGEMTLGGSLTLDIGSIFELQMDSTLGIADKIVANGLTLGGFLSFSDLGDSLLTLGTQFVIMENSAFGSVNGYFTGLAEGSIFSGGVNQYSISYIGGTGNDVVLTVIPEPGFLGLLGLGALFVAIRPRRFLA